jgi:DNA-binding CsgD family transcriptional regulator
VVRDEWEGGAEVRDRHNTPTSGHLIARDDERLLVRAVCQEAAAGRGSSLLLVGEPGIGKSAVLADGVHEAGRGGVQVVAIEGVRGEAELPWAGLSQLIIAGRQHLDRLDPATADVLQHAVSLDPGGIVSRQSVLVAAHALLIEWASTGPLVVVADDLHWLDSESTAALVYAARRLGDTPVGILAATRDATGVDMPIVHRLTALDDRAAHELLEEAAPGPIHPIVREQLVTGASGNPLALQSTLSVLTPGQLAGSEPLPDPLPLSPGLDRMLAARVEALPVATRRALAAFATIATADHEIGEVLDLAEVGAEAFHGAEAAGIVEITGRSIRFTHPLYRSAAYWTFAAPDRRELHRRRSQTESDPVRRALHRADGQVGSDPVLARELETLAGQAAARGASGLASRLFERAATLHDDPGARHRCELESAESALEVGNLALAAARVATIPADVEPARVLEVRAALADAAGDHVEAVRLWEEAVRCSDDPSSAADLVIAAGTSLCRRAEIGPLNTLMVNAGLETGSLDPERSAKVDVLTGAAAIATGHLTAASLEQFDRFRELEQLDDTDLVPHLSFLADAMCVTLGIFAAHDDLFRLTARIERLAVERTIPSVMPGVHTGRGIVYNRINGPAAAAHLQEAVDLAAALGHRTLGTSAECFLAFVLGRLGSPETLPLTERMIASDLINLRVSALHGRAAYWMTHGEPNRALEELLQLYNDPDLDWQAFVQRWQADLGEAAVRCGELALAREVIDRIAALGDYAANSRLAPARHYLEGMLAPVDECNVHFQAAVDASPGDASAWVRAKAELLWGERLRRARRRAEARPHLEEARALFERQGYGMWAERAEQELVAAGDPRMMSDHSGDAERLLTPHELHVARLASSGASYKDIAGRLFISPRTVETHLSSIYRKLGVKNRAGLMSRASHDAALSTVG